MGNRLGVVVIAVAAVAALTACGAPVELVDDAPTPTTSSPASPASPGTTPSTPGGTGGDGGGTGGDSGAQPTCDQVTATDPRCRTTRYGSNLEALDDFLDGVEEWGGIRETTATAQGITEVAVGSTVDMLLAQIPLDLSTVIDSAGACTASLDPTAQLGVVAVRTPGPRGEVDAIQAVLIGNPVVRTSDDLGVGSTLEDLEAAVAGLRVERTGDGWWAVSAPEPAREGLAAVSDRRMMSFRLNGDGRVSEWSVGVPEFALGLCATA